MPDGKNENIIGDYVLLRPNRRKEIRRHLLILRVNGENENIFFGYAKNLSKGGMFIATVNPRNPGEEFTISFKLPDLETKIIVRCRVQWARQYNPDSKHEPGMGLRFIDLNHDMQKKVEEWVKKTA